MLTNLLEVLLHLRLTANLIEITLQEKYDNNGAPLIASQQSLLSTMALLRIDPGTATPVIPLTPMAYLVDGSG
jgi:hypothetical protein